MDEPTDPAAKPCGHEANGTQLYEIYRHYIVHEDDLINNRVGWFIQLHSFLIASYGIVVAAIISTFFPQSQPLAPVILPQAVACMLLVGIAVIGLASSASAFKSIDAAHKAIAGLCEDWAANLKRLGGGGILPGIIGGGRLNPNNLDADFHLKLPRGLTGLWWFSFLVPAAFMGIAIWTEVISLQTGAHATARQLPGAVSVLRPPAAPAPLAPLAAPKAAAKS